MTARLFYCESESGLRAMGQCLRAMGQCFKIDKTELAGDSQVIRSQYADVNIPRTTLPGVILPACDARSAEVAMVEGMSGKEYTYGELAEMARGVAGGLAQRASDPKGQVLAVYMPNTPEYFAVVYGALLVGSVATLMNPTYGKTELEHALTLTEPKYVFTVSAMLPSLEDALQATGRPAIVLVDSAPAELKRVQLPLLRLDSGKNPVMRRGAPFVECTDPDALALLPYSSGTTGLPKAVMLTHRNVVANLLQATSGGSENLDISERTVMLAVLPFFHIYGLIIFLVAGPFKGAKTVSMPKFVPDAYAKLLKEHKVTVAHVAPPLVNFMLKHPAMDAVLPLPDLKEIFCGAAPLGEEPAEAVKQKLGISLVRQGYGMTEMSPVSHIGPKSNPKVGAIGLLVPNMECKLVSPEDGSLVAQRGPAHRGELWLRGPNIMRGYYKNPEATAECLDAEGYLHTGDVGYLDEDGQIWIVDRIKELIKVKGFQVAPAELEAALTQCPQVADAGVIGVAAGYSYGGREGDGQLPKAFVVKKDPDVTEEEVKDWVLAQLNAPYKALCAVQFVDSVPKTASGKILRKDLRKMEEAQGGKVFG